jgi:ABC-type glycerol-3-phosphate transport system permease component
MAQATYPFSRPLVRKRVRQIAGKTLLYVILVAGAVFLIAPLLWMISTSLKAPGKELTFPPQWIPNPTVWYNYLEIWSFKPFARYFYNSFVITFGATAGSMLVSSLVAFGFARMRFWGRDVLFAILLSTLMLPAVVTLLPTFILFKELRWLDTFLPLIVPSWLGQGAYGQGAFYIFLMRQFYLTIPYEFDEAARVDGANPIQIYWRIILPLSVPALVAVGIFSFLANWNDFLYPVVFLSSPQMLTVALGMRSMMQAAERGVPWGLLMVISFLTIIPPVVVLLVGQKYFIRGVVMSGLAGR